MLTQSEREKYAAIWATPGYEVFSPGEDAAKRFVSTLSPPKGATVLDAGCGAGKGGLALEMLGLRVWYLDLTSAGIDLELGVDRRRFIQQPLWERIQVPLGWGRYDYGYCCDVMEHLPTEYTMLAARNIIDACTTTWFQIAFFHDGWGSAIGEDLHLTVRPFAWWLERLKAIGNVVDARDLCGAGVFVMERGR